MDGYPIRLAIDDDLRRSRLTVFFRLALYIPHYIWTVLWALALYIVLIVNWFATLIMGRSPEGLHKFTASFLRYQTHVAAFVYLIANPFPGFAGEPGSYPVDLQIDPPQRQNRLITLFRMVLALPALILTYVLMLVLYVVAFLGWFAALALGRMPRGMRDLGAFGLRYWAQTAAYMLLLTDRYPPLQTGSPEGSSSQESQPLKAQPAA